LTVSTTENDPALTDYASRVDALVELRCRECLFKMQPLEHAILASANVSIIATDEKGAIQMFNAGAERMLGYRAADALNKITVSDLFDAQEMMARAKELSVEMKTTIKPGFETLIFKAACGMGDIYELTTIRNDGSRFPAVVSVTTLRNDEGGTLGFLLLVTDNSARQRLESDRTEALAAAQKASRAKSEFISSMSHELRTPLNSILGFAQLIESGATEPTPSQKRSLEQILKAGWHLLELINEVLDLSLIESGKVRMSREPVSLDDVMLECRAMIESQADVRGIGLSFQELALPNFVQADRIRLKQVLINLLFNAIKYNKPGGAVAVECTLISPDSIRISVRDTGLGMTQEQLAQLFQPFNRLGKESGAEEGTGMGLVVTKRLVELMGGTIGVGSTLGVGSVFWVELSRTTAPQLALDEGEGAVPVSPQFRDGAPPCTLLYVEDNPVNLELVEQLIARRPDIHLLSAKDGIRGIEMARASLPDVILMDINLPGISGIEALKILAKDPSTAPIPVIALSAKAVPGDIEVGLQAGFFRYLTKPVKVSELMDTLDLALEFAKNANDARGQQEVSTHRNEWPVN